MAILKHYKTLCTRGIKCPAFSALVSHCILQVCEGSTLPKAHITCLGFCYILCYSAVCLLQRGKWQKLADSLSPVKSLSMFLVSKEGSSFEQ